MPKLTRLLGIKYYNKIFHQFKNCHEWFNQTVVLTYFIASFWGGGGTSPKVGSALESGSGCASLLSALAQNDEWLMNVTHFSSLFVDILRSSFVSYGYVIYLLYIAI